MPLTPDEIANRTMFHKGTEVTGPLHAQVRAKFHMIMEQLNDILPDGRAKSICMTQLEDSEMWANKAVAELAPLVGE